MRRCSGARPVDVADTHAHRSVPLRRRSSTDVGGDWSTPFRQSGCSERIVTFFSPSHRFSLVSDVKGRRLVRHCCLCFCRVRTDGRGYGQTCARTDVRHVQTRTRTDVRHVQTRTRTDVRHVQTRTRTDVRHEQTWTRTVVRHVQTRTRTDVRHGRAAIAKNTPTFNISINNKEKKRQLLWVPFHSHYPDIILLPLINDL